VSSGSYRSSFTRMPDCGVACVGTVLRLINDINNITPNVALVTNLMQFIII
jgi:hypothetical protein